MATKLSAEDCAAARSVSRRSGKRDLQLFAAVERCLQAVLAWLCRRLLALFADLQDALLAIGAVRRLVAFALAPGCTAAVLARVKEADSGMESFEKLRYSVSSEARQLLIHAGMHAFIASNATGESQLPPIGRILLQTGVPQSGRFQEAVAGALAHELKACLLVVDDSLLSQLAKQALGSPAKDAEESSLGFCAYILSFWLSGGRVAFLWSVLHRICTKLERNAVVLIKDVEKTVCGSIDSFNAFASAFGSLEEETASPSDPQGSQENSSSMVLLGGSGLKVKDPTSALPSLQSLLEKASESARRPNFGGGGEDTFSILPELGLAMMDDTPEPHSLLEQLFMTQVKLIVPAGAPKAEQHMQQMAEDAAELIAERNLKHLTSLGLQRQGLPATSSPLLQKRKLSQDEWAKVVTWAKSMEAILKTNDAFEALKLSQDERDASQTLNLEASTSATIRRSPSASDSHGLLLDSIPSAEQKAQRQVKCRRKDSKANAEAQTDADTRLSERALWYGLRMLERGANGSRPRIKTENAFERRLLKEVVRPEDAGSGFAEIGALAGPKEALREVVQLPLQRPELFATGSLAKLSKGVLLFGPPGTGKTMLARAVAAECGAAFLAIHPSAVASKWLGDGVRYVKAAFSLAAKLAPCVVFLDEVDALLSRRNTTHEHEALREMKNEAMAQWDGIRSNGGGPRSRVIVMGATNRPQDLDEAVLRRFSRRIFCDVPDRKARLQILQVMLAGDNLADDVELSKVADRTDGYSGSDLREVCTAAAMRPLRELLKSAGQPAALDNTSLSEQQNGSLNDHSEASEQAMALTADSSGSSARASGQRAQASDASRPDAESTLQSSEPGTDTHDDTNDVRSPTPTAMMMGHLMNDCDRMASSAHLVSTSKLRKLTTDDFLAAIQRTAPSTDENSHAMDELRQWNAKYGETSGDGRYRNPKLSYFI